MAAISMDLYPLALSQNMIFPTRPSLLPWLWTTGPFRLQMDAWHRELLPLLRGSERAAEGAHWAAEVP